MFRVGVSLVMLGSVLGMFAGTVAAQAEAGVTVTDESAPGSVAPGESFDVTIDVETIGDSAGSSTGIQFQDVPEGISFESGGTTYGEGEGPISLTALDPQEKESFDVTVNVNDDISAGDYDFTVAGAVTESFTGEAVVDFTVADAVANISVVEEPEPDTVSSGDSFTTVIEITNTGQATGTATGLKFADAPQRTTFQSKGSNYSIGEGPVSIAALEPGESESFEVNVMLPSEIEAGDYNLSVDATVSNEVFTDMTQISFAVEEGVERFNTGGSNDDTPNTIDQGETLSAISQYNSGAVSDQKLILEVITAYNNQTRL